MAVTSHPTTFLCALAIFLFLATPTDSAKLNGNVLKSGSKLDGGESLVHGSNRLAMQKDCNLVLYNNETAIWSSGTEEKGFNCFLVLQNDGELVIISDFRSTVWRSQTGARSGKYALVLQPNGDAVVYGPYGDPVWSTGTTNIERPKN